MCMIQGVEMGVLSTGGLRVVRLSGRLRGAGVPRVPGQGGDAWIAVIWISVVGGLQCLPREGSGQLTVTALSGIDAEVVRRQLSVSPARCAVWSWWVGHV